MTCSSYCNKLSQSALHSLMVKPNINSNNKLWIKMRRRLRETSTVHTWVILHRWQSAASSRPCFSAQASTLDNLLFSLIPHSLVIRPSCGSITSLLNSHMFIKWNSCENSCIVRAALTLQRRSSDIADDSTWRTSPGIFKHILLTIFIFLVKIKSFF